VLLANVGKFIGRASFTRFVTDRLDELVMGRSSDADLFFLTCGVMLLTSSVENVFGPASSTQFVMCSPPVISIVTLNKISEGVPIVEQSFYRGQVFEKAILPSSLHRGAPEWFGNVVVQMAREKYIQKVTARARR